MLGKLPNTALWNGHQVSTIWVFDFNGNEHQTIRPMLNYYPYQDMNAFSMVQALFEAISISPL